MVNYIMSSQVFLINYCELGITIVTYKLIEINAFYFCKFYDLALSDTQGSTKMLFVLYDR